VKDVGLVGVPFSGKSTLFTAMTRAGSQDGQANIAVVPVPDPRLQVLTDMESSKKTVAAQVYYEHALLRICRQYSPPGLRIAVTGRRDAFRCRFGRLFGDFGGGPPARHDRRRGHLPPQIR